MGSPFANTIRLKIGGRAPADVEELCLDGAKCGDNLGELSKFSNLAKLELNYCDLASLKGFPALPALRQLMLSDNKISNVEALTVVTNLEMLVLSGNRIKNVEDLAPLAQLKNLKTLDVQYHEFTKTANYREKVFELLPQLEVVDERDSSGQEQLLNEDDDDEEDDEEEEEEDDAAEAGGAAAKAGSDTDEEEDDEEDEDEEDDGPIEAGQSDSDAEEELGEDDDDDDLPPRGTGGSESGSEGDATFRNVVLGDDYQDEDDDGDFVPVEESLAQDDDIDIADEDEDDFAVAGKHCREGLDPDDILGEPPAKR